jgi:glycosyltransferase involved in cell wall biosynthesis
MKVLHIEDRFHPGMGYQINFFARYHHPDHSFSILCSDSSRLWTASDDRHDLQSADKQFAEDFAVSVYRLPSLLDRRTRQNLWLKGLIRAIRKLDPDILYVHTLESYSSIRILLSRKVLSRYAVFFDTHTLLNQFRPGLKFSMFKYFFKQVASRRIQAYGAKVFATVPENKMILEREYGISTDHILYTPIGTDLSMFRFDDKARKAGRQKEHIPEKGTLLLYTGKMNFRKNPHLILEAVDLIEERIDQPLYIYFVGAADAGYKDQYLEREFKQENIHFKLIPAVAVSELYAWYSTADFAVFPDENTLSALDAQACRLPVIMAADMTNAERLSRGGMTYTSGDLEDLSHKIMDMISDPEKRSSLGKEGETYVRSTYDYRKIVRDMESDLGLFH